MIIVSRTWFDMRSRITYIENSTSKLAKMTVHSKGSTQLNFLILLFFLYLVDKNFLSPNKIAILMCNLNVFIRGCGRILAKDVKILLFVIYVMALALCCFYDKSVTVAGLHSQTWKGFICPFKLGKSNKLHCSFYDGWRKRQFPLFSIESLFGPMPMIKEIEFLLLQPYLLGFGFKIC